ncbi:MAG: coenzyme F420-0:L-glutamate ligase [Oscillospiraceae bacterium]|nr:coenzyme F420-0:L-glutamate ligase [Oscillospiraceae bacterium]
MADNINEKVYEETQNDTNEELNSAEELQSEDSAEVVADDSSSERSVGMIDPNQGKNLVIETSTGKYERHPVRTKVVMSGDNLEEILAECVSPYIAEGDMVFMSEKIVAISQGRAFPVSEIKPSKLAKFLVKFVYKSPYGIGLGIPTTMELAIREVGRVKIVLCAIIAGICKVFGVRGVFYNMLGEQVRAIDGPCDYTIPPYNTYAKMAPAKPHEVSKRLTKFMGGNKVVIVDANDLGVNILGKPETDTPDEVFADIFKDNPLGQAAQQTPIAIVRKIG